MGYNQNAGYGQASAIALTATTMGKTFIVQPTSYPNVDMITDIFQPDFNGVVRVYNTLTTALAACTDGNGDTIYVAPGYTETISTAAGLTIAKSGVSIIGLGQGSLRPTITSATAVAASIDITASNVTLQNIIITCGIDNQTAMVNVTGTDVSFLDCRINTNNATIGAALGILTAATATNLVVDRCWFHGPATNSGTTTTAQIKHEVGTDYKIQNSYFTGKVTQNILNTATVLRGLIHNNLFVTYTGTKAIAMAAASTPFITNNRINVPSGTTPVVADAGFVAGNAYSAAA